MNLFQVPSISESTRSSISSSDFQSVTSNNFNQEDIVMSDFSPEAMNTSQSTTQHSPTTSLLSPQQIAQIVAAIQIQK